MSGKSSNPKWQAIWAQEASDRILQRIACQLADIAVEEFSRAETNIFKILVEQDIMCSAKVGDMDVAKLV